MISPVFTVRSSPSSSPLIFHHQLQTFSHRLLPLSYSWNVQRNVPNKFGRHTFKCRLAKAKDPSPSLVSLAREPHKYFDQAVITIPAGDGDHGVTLSMRDQKAASKSSSKEEKAKVRIRGAYKRDFDSSLIIPVGGQGGVLRHDGNANGRRI